VLLQPDFLSVEETTMIATILLVTLIRAAAAVAVAFFFGVAAGYAFRGKERAALASLGQDIKKKL
jgi:ABC-type anion transport system duplicated permease subunit